MPTFTRTNALKVWAARAKKAFKGREIVDVRYMTDEERKQQMWSEAPIVFVLDNGQLFFPTSDDEGNSPGAIHTTYPDLEVIPRI